MTTKIQETEEKVAQAETGAPTDAGASPDAEAKASEATSEGDAADKTDAATDADKTASAGDTGFAEQVKRIALAAAEAVSISPDDVKGFVSKLVEKGELAQKDGKRIVQDLGDRLKQAVREPASTAQKAREKAEDALRSLAGRLGRKEKGEEAEAPEAEGVQALAKRINASIERVLGAMHIASASEIRALREKLDALDAKIEKALEKQP